MKFEVITVGPIEENCIVAYCDRHKSAIVVDPGDSGKKIISFIEANELIPKLVLNTHCHSDHTGAIKTIVEHFDIPFLCHEEDVWMLSSQEQLDTAEYMGLKAPPLNDATVSDGEIVDLCDCLALEVIHTPGHTKGGICLYGDGKLISGDTIFQQSIGRSDWEYSNHDTLIKSIKTRLFILPDETVIYPGHGGTTTIGLEKARNPFLRQTEGYA